ncbi:MAG: Rpn family recombination-promoting nuclease/putative transposase [Acidobacteria bacterium]|nr:Rpn family recombination-promoting nuclease/putative transposase [Acidobacteriota bacterium]
MSDTHSTANSKTRSRAGTDNLCKYLAERNPELFASLFLGRAVTKARVLKTELMSPPIHADSVILLDTGDELLHLEFQTDPKSAPPIEFRMLDYWVRLFRKYGKASRQFVVLLKQTKVVVRDEFVCDQTRHKFHLVKMWEQDPQEFMQHEASLPLATLCRTAAPAALLEALAEKINAIEPLALRRNVSGWAQVIAGLRFDNEMVRNIFQEGLMRESSVYQAILKEGEQQGFKKGQLEGERDLVARQLAQQVGKLSARVKQQIETLSRTQIEALGTALLNFKTKADLREWLNRQNLAH